MVLWFLDFRSSPPGDSTRWRNIYHGGRILAWYTRLSSSGIFVKIASLSVQFLLPESVFLACFAFTIKETRIRETLRLDHVDRLDRWILHGGCQTLVFTFLCGSCERIRTKLGTPVNFHFKIIDLMPNTCRWLRRENYSKSYSKQNEFCDSIITQLFNPFSSCSFVSLLTTLSSF